MNGLAPSVERVEASCAICGLPSTHGECSHEGQSLERALDQAIERWEGLRDIRSFEPRPTRSRDTDDQSSYRQWVLDHARNQIINTFEQLKAQRKQAHYAYLQTIPCFTLYQKYRGNPPILPQQLHHLHSQISQAQAVFQAGVDEDWRRSCLRYPEVLDYYFSLIEFTMPNDNDSVIQEPRFGAPLKGTRRLKARRGSVDSGQIYRKKGRRRSRSRNSRGRTPPAAPMADAYRR